MHAGWSCVVSTHTRAHVCTLADRVSSARTRARVRAHTHKHARTHTHMHAYRHSLTLTHTHSRTHSLTHAHTHTHTHTHTTALQSDMRARMDTQATPRCRRTSTSAALLNPGVYARAVALTNTIRRNVACCKGCRRGGGISLLRAVKSNTATQAQDFSSREFSRRNF